MVTSRLGTKQNGEGWIVALAFLLPLTQLIQVNVIGTLFLQDLIAPVLMIALLSMPGAAARLRPLATFLVLAGVWLLGAIITDLYRGTPVDDFARGWSRIALFTIHKVTLWLLAGGRFKVLGWYFLASGLANILQAFLLPSEFADADPWKFGLGGGIVLMATGLSTFTEIRTAFGRYSFSFLLLILAVVSFLQDSRSLFAITLLASTYSAMAIWISNRPNISRRITLASFSIFCLLGVLFVQLILLVYSYAAETGLLGADSRAKFLVQSGGDANILLAGRSEIIVSLQAIWDSPIIGHGSWAQNPYYVFQYFGELTARGLPSPVNYYIENFGYIIPTHSYIFGAWVEAGILGLPIWIWLFYVVAKALYSILKENEFSSQLVALPAFLLLWDIPFSPFNSVARIGVAAQICVILSASLMMKYKLDARQVRRALPGNPTQ